MEWWSKELKWDVVDNGVELRATGAALCMSCGRRRGNEKREMIPIIIMTCVPSFEVCRRPDKCDVIGSPSPI